LDKPCSVKAQIFDGILQKSAEEGSQSATFEAIFCKSTRKDGLLQRRLIQNSR